MGKFFFVLLLCHSFLKLLSLLFLSNMFHFIRQVLVFDKKEKIRVVLLLLHNFTPLENSVSKPPALLLHKCVPLYNS